MLIYNTEFNSNCQLSFSKRMDIQWRCDKNARTNRKKNFSFTLKFNSQFYLFLLIKSFLCICFVRHLGISFDNCIKRKFTSKRRCHTAQETMYVFYLKYEKKIYSASLLFYYKSFLYLFCVVSHSEKFRANCH